MRIKAIAFEKWSNQNMGWNGKFISKENSGGQITNIGVT